MGKHLDQPPIFNSNNDDDDDVEIKLARSQQVGYKNKQSLTNLHVTVYSPSPSLLFHYAHLTSSICIDVRERKK